MSSKKTKLIESAQKNFLKGQYGRAVDEYRQVIQLDPGDIRHRQRLAEILTKADQRDEAIREYTFLAKHYIDSAHLLKAIAVYKQIQKLDPTNPDVSLTLASLNEKQGLIGNATAEYASAVHIFESKGDNSKALKALESMLAIDPRNCAVRMRIAEKYYSIGREDQAADEFVAIACDLQERADESGFMHIADRINRLFPEKAATLFDRIQQEQEPVADDGEVPLPSAPAAGAPPAEPAAAPEIPAVAADFPKTESTDAAVDELDLIEDILPLEDDEEIEELADLDLITETPEDADWEEEIDFTDLSFEAPAEELPVDTTPDSAAGVEPDSELEDIELVLEIVPDEQPDTAATSAEGQVAAWLPTGSDSSFDLGKELSIFADDIDFDLIRTDKGDSAFAPDSPSGFKKNELDTEDIESHYSLGLAYREMGLFDEAISEFIVASRSAERKIDCLILQGICFRDLGDVGKAAEFLADILNRPGLKEDEVLGIKYELAVCYEALDETLQAKKLYSEIIAVRADFSDTAARLSQL